MLGGRLIKLVCNYCKRASEEVAIEGVPALQTRLKQDGWKVCMGYNVCNECEDDEVTAVDLDAPARARASVAPVLLDFHTFDFARSVEEQIEESRAAGRESEQLSAVGRMVLRGGAGGSGVRRVST